MTKTLQWIVILIADPRSIMAVIVGIVAEGTGQWHPGAARWSGVVEDLSAFLLNLFLIVSLLKLSPAGLRHWRTAWGRRRLSSLIGRPRQ